MAISDHAIRAMGFDDLPSPRQLSAKFYGYTVYEVQGLALALGTCGVIKGSAAAVPYQVAVSADLNAACRAINQGDFTDDELQWKEEHRAVGPFALVQVGPTSEYEATVSRICQGPHGALISYDEFASARAEVRALETRALPRIASALTCVLNKPQHDVSLRKVDRATVGQLKDGINLHDMRVEVKAEGVVGRHIDSDELGRRLSRAAGLAQVLPERVARFLALGMGERDELKQFLFFFLAIEVETRAAFGKVDHDAGVTAILNANTDAPTKSLVERQVAALANLYDQFAWCAACVWRHLDPPSSTLRRRFCPESARCPQ